MVEIVIEIRSYGYKIVSEIFVFVTTSRNQLAEVPHSINQLPNLRILNLSDNRLTSLPSEIGAGEMLFYNILQYSLLCS